jgi:DNA-binding NarL/FixJ family response regulator
MEADPPTQAPPVGLDKALILLVDDHPVLRRGAASLLEREPDFAVCAEAGNAADALEALRRLRPQAAVIDISLPGTDGIQLIKLMKRAQPKVKILVLSMQEEWEYGLPALRAGANGYLMKDHTASELVPALRHVMKDLLYMSPALTRRFLALGADEPAEASEDRCLTGVGAAQDSADSHR